MCHLKTHQFLHLFTSTYWTDVKLPSKKPKKTRKTTKKTTILVIFWASWYHQEYVYVKYKPAISIIYKKFTICIDVSIFLKKEEVINFQQINISETYTNIVQCYRSEIIGRILIHVAHFYNFLAFAIF